MTRPMLRGLCGACGREVSVRPYYAGTRPGARPVPHKPLDGARWCTGAFIPAQILAGGKADG